MASEPQTLRIGLISDTHGLLRPQALETLRGSDFIIHAGDIGDARILAQLEAIAPVTAVRGNNDADAAFARVPERAELRAGTVRILVLHDLSGLRIDPAAAGLHVVVSGHSHKPCCERRGGVLYVNPGGAGPRRFKLPVTTGRLLIEGDRVDAELVELLPRS